MREGGYDKNAAEVHLGLPWTPTEFIDQARQLEHPFAKQAVVPDRSLRAIFHVLTKGPKGIAEVRRKELERWTRRAKELDGTERNLFSEAPAEVQARWGRHPDAAEALKGPWRGKRTQLLLEMALEAGVPSARMVIELLRSGAPPFGEVPRSGAFAEKEHLATKSFKDVLQGTKWSLPVLRATVRPHKDRRVDQEVWERTEEEVAEGKAIGPLTEEQASQMFDGIWAPCRRVGLMQGDSIRPIDDFSEFGHNGTSETGDYIELGGVDAVCGLMKAWAEAARDDGQVRVERLGGGRAATPRLCRPPRASPLRASTRSTTSL